MSVKRIAPFAELPAKWQAKILAPGENEITPCWPWKGAITGESHALPHVPPGRVHRLEQRRLTRRRPVPNVWLPEKGYPVPAYRAVWCRLTGTPYDNMPEIRRCTHDLCVNPHHIRVRGNHRRQPEPDFRVRPPAETRDMIWAILTTRTPNPDLSDQSAADEVNLTSIPAEIWNEYRSWCIDNYTYPEEDD